MELSKKPEDFTIIDTVRFPVHALIQSIGEARNRSWSAYATWRLRDGDISGTATFTNKHLSVLLDSLMFFDLTVLRGQFELDKTELSRKPMRVFYDEGLHQSMRQAVRRYCAHQNRMSF